MENKGQPKKVWSKPDVIIISRCSIQYKSFHSHHEGSFNPTPNGYSVKGPSHTFHSVPKGSVLNFLS